MTISKPKQGKYDPNHNPVPTIVNIGCEIATREMEDYDMGNGEMTYVPIKTQIVFLEVPREIVFNEKGSCSYNTVAALLQKQGYSRAMWTIRSIWQCQDDTNIF